MIKSFSLLKEKLLTSNILSYYNTKKQTVITCYASFAAMGCVLSQENAKNSFSPVFFHSQTFSPFQQKYSIGEKEALAIVITLKKSRFFIRETFCGRNRSTSFNPASKENKKQR